MSTPTNQAIDLFAAFATDTTKEVEGTETELPGCGDVKFIVAREGNPNYAKMLQKLVKQNRAVLDSKGDAAQAKSDEILISVMAETILLGWNRPIKFGAEMLDYTKPNAKKLLALKEFRRVVMEAAGSLETFKAVKDEEDTKNS